MAYLEVHQELIDHPKTKRAARHLGVSRPTMVGHLFMFWSWCMDYARDGDVTDVDWQDIADAAHWLGEPEVFRNALIKSAVRPDGHGFLEQTEDQRVLIHDWRPDCENPLCRIRIRTFPGQPGWDEWMALRRKVLAVHGMVCGLCGGIISRDELHIDHIIPRSKGGTDAFSNLQPAHARCNLSKGSRQWRG